jgi:hypothetical protein
VKRYGSKPVLAYILVRTVRGVKGGDKRSWRGLPRHARGVVGVQYPLRIYNPQLQDSCKDANNDSPHL